MTVRGVLITLGVCALVMGLQVLALVADWYTRTP